METLDHKQRNRVNIESAKSAPKRFILEDMTNLSEASTFQGLQRKHHFPSQSMKDCAVSRSYAISECYHDITSVANTPDCRNSNSSLRHSILDKDLPSKPQPQVLKHDAHRCSLVRDDVMDFPAAKRLSSYARATKGESLSDMGSFNTTSSLRSVPGDTTSDVEFGIAVTKTSQHVGAHALRLGSYVKGINGDNALASSGASLCSPDIYALSPRNSINSQPRSLTHIATQSSCSAVVCGPIMSRFARREPDETRQVSSKVNPTPRRRSTKYSATRDPFYEPKSDNNPAIDDISAIRQASKNLSLSIIDVSRRSETFGTGATVRFSKDAHEVIMGRSPRNMGCSMPSRLAVTSPTAKFSRPNVPAVKACNKSQKVVTLNPPSRDESCSFHAQMSGGVCEDAAPQCYQEFPKQSLPSDKLKARSAPLPGLYFASPVTQPSEVKGVKEKRSPNDYSPLSQLPRYKPGKVMLSNNGTYGALLPQNNHASKKILWKYGKSPLKPANKDSSQLSNNPMAPSSKQPAKPSTKGIKGRVSAILLGRRSSGDVGDANTQRNSIPKRSNEANTESIATPICKEARVPSKKISTSSLRNIVRPTDTGPRKISPLVQTTQFSAAELFTARSIAAKSHRSESTTETVSGPYNVVESNDALFDRGSSKQGDSDRDPFDETGVSHFYDVQLNEAQSSLDHIIEACRVIEDPELKATVASAIHMAGNSILASREARMANIALSNAVAGLVKQSSRLTAAACSAALKASSVSV